MKKILLAAIVALTSASCAGFMASQVGMWPQEDEGYEIDSDSFLENEAYIRYESIEFLRNVRNSKRNIFGQIRIQTTAWDSYSANLKNWLFILKDANQKEIHRGSGRDMNVPGTDHKDNYGTGHFYTSGTYSNFHDITLKEAAEFPLYLEIISGRGTVINFTVIKK
jgi:hypothetical protein